MDCGSYLQFEGSCRNTRAAAIHEVECVAAAMQDVRLQRLPGWVKISLPQCRNISPFILSLIYWPLKTNLYFMSKSKKKFIAHVKNALAKCLPYKYFEINFTKCHFDYKLSISYKTGLHAVSMTCTTSTSTLIE